MPTNVSSPVNRPKSLSPGDGATLLYSHVPSSTGSKSPNVAFLCLKGTKERLTSPPATRPSKLAHSSPIRLTWDAAAKNELSSDEIRMVRVGGSPSKGSTHQRISFSTSLRNSDLIDIYVNFAPQTMTQLG